MKIGLLDKFKLFRTFSSRLKEVSLTDFKSFKDTFSEWLNVNGGNTKNSGYIFACSNIWGLSFAKTLHYLYDSEEDNEKVDVHPFNELMKKPNWFQTAWEIKYRQAWELIWEGNSYLMKLRDSMGVPRALIQLHPSRIQTYPYNFERIDYYVYNTGAELLNIPKSEIIHFRLPSKDNYIKGTPLINYIDNLREIESLQNEYRKQFYKKGGFLGATFTTDQQLKGDSFKNAKDQLQAKYGGSAENAFNIALFDSGLKPIPTAYSPKDMQMKDERALNRDEICSAFGVNKLLMGQSEAIQRGNADTVYYVFYTQIIDPLMDYFDQVYTTQLIETDFSIDGQTPYYVQHDKLANRDLQMDLMYYKNGLGGDNNDPWLSVDDVRIAEGKPALGGVYAKPTVRGNNQPITQPV